MHSFYVHPGVSIDCNIFVVHDDNDDIVVEFDLVVDGDNSFGIFRRPLPMRCNTGKC